MSVPHPSTQQLTRALLLSAGVAACGSGLALGASAPTLHTSRGCYVVKQPVRLHGTGFAPSRTYVLSVDGVYFGQGTTDSHGALLPPPILPGGLPAGSAQSVDQVQASDGTNTATASFTLTRPAGVRFLQTSGSGTSLRAPIEVWGYSLGGTKRGVYLHYVGPTGHRRTTVALGHTGGQCGYLRTSPRKIFPFTPTRGTWTFQIDTRSRYARHPGGPVRRITVAVH